MPFPVRSRTRAPSTQPQAGASATSGFAMFERVYPAHTNGSRRWMRSDRRPTTWKDLGMTLAPEYSGRTSMDKHEVVEQCARDSVAFVRLQFTEPYGAVKNVSIPVDELEKALDNELMFDGSSIRGFKRIEQSDMYFLPDPHTYALLPWRGTDTARTARLICDVADPDGQPFAGDPRSNLKRVLKQAEELGYTMQVGPEAEFFLFRLDGEGNPTVDPHDAASYFDVAPLDKGEDCRRDIEVTLQQMGFHLEAAHHEVAIGQHEIDFRHADALTTADNLITFRQVVKVIAARHGMHATFMAKPIHGENGSGMHVNQSLARGEENAFLDASADP